MDKMESRSDARAFLRSAQAFAALDQLEQHVPRTSRERVPPPLDKARARQACAPMGTLHSIVVTVNAHKRRRTWYVVDPDTAVAPQYAAADCLVSSAPRKATILPSAPRTAIRCRTASIPTSTCLQADCSACANPCDINQPKLWVVASGLVTRSISTTKYPARPTSSF